VLRNSNDYRRAMVALGRISCGRSYFKTLFANIHHQKLSRFSSYQEIQSGNNNTDFGKKNWKVFLSGEIHTDWRDVIRAGVREKNLPISLSSPNTSHADSDDCGAIILGMEEKRRHWDSIGARMNAIRNKTLLEEADIVIIKFGDKYRQWNAAFDAGYAAALKKCLITLHPPNLGHMLKEVNASAHVVCEDASQVLDTLAYVTEGILPSVPRDGSHFIPIADRLGAGNPNP